MPYTTYYFANAGNSAAGGAAFTTDGNGLGPNDSNPWSAANYFGGTFSYWLDRASTSSTQWSNSYYNQSCIGWTNGGAQHGHYSYSATAGSKRWEGVPAILGCDRTYHVICYVNP